MESPAHFNIIFFLKNVSLHYSIFSRVSFTIPYKYFISSKYIHSIPHNLLVQTKHMIILQKTTKLQSPLEWDFFLPVARARKVLSHHIPKSYFPKLFPSITHEG